MGDLRLRRARPDEFEFFYELRRDAFRSYVEQARGAWVDAVQRPGAKADFDAMAVEIVERDGLAIGYQAVERHDDHWFLAEIAVIASLRDQGIGTELVTSVMAGARQAGCPLRLNVLEHNPAQQLWLRLGFHVTKIESPRVKMEWPSRGVSRQ